MSDKKAVRLRRAKSTRLRIKSLGENRLAVYRSNQHIYAQVIASCGSKVLASASTVEKGFETSACNKDTAALIGKAIAERARSVGIVKVAFDRSGFRYHGRIKALADAAREHGLEF